MVSAYPQNLDTYRKHLAGFDYMSSHNLVDLLDAAAAIQAMMGVNPSGEMGTVSARLFENGNLSETFSGWNRLLWNGNQVVAQSSAFHFDLSAGGGYRLDFGAARFEGKDTEFGEGVPTAFGALQGPINSGFGSNGRGRVPWRHMIARVEDDFVKWVGRDGENSQLLTSNSAPCRWGYLLWNLITHTEDPGG